MSPRGAVLAALGVAFACGGHTARYTPERDAVAMSAIASAWSESGGLALSLCEDVARSAAWTGPDGCQVDQVVRGGGAGTAHDETREGGCGGCPYHAIAYVRGTADGAGLTGSVPVSGTVVLQSTLSDDPYAFPYSVHLECDDAQQPCAVIATLAADGRLSGTLLRGSPGSPVAAGAPGTTESDHVLLRVGAATCP